MSCVYYSRKVEASEGTAAPNGSCMTCSANCSDQRLLVDVGNDYDSAARHFSTLNHCDCRTPYLAAGQQYMNGGCAMLYLTRGCRSAAPKDSQLQRRTTPWLESSHQSKSTHCWDRKLHLLLDRLRPWLAGVYSHDAYLAEYHCLVYTLHLWTSRLSGHGL
jgi:hypothetical protein